MVADRAPCRSPWRPPNFPEDRRLYLALEHIAKKWTMPVQNWKAALQRFAILLGGRVPKAEMA
jgi:transposase-like protein